MKKILIAIILLATTAGMYSCKKYDEGPALSLRSKNARVVNDWVLDKATNGGLDVTSSYPDVYNFNFAKDGTYTFNYNNVETTGTWALSDKKDQLVLTDGASGTEYLFTIIMLKNKALTLEQTVLTETVKLYFVEKV